MDCRCIKCRFRSNDNTPIFKVRCGNKKSQNYNKLLDIKEHCENFERRIYKDYVICFESERYDIETHASPTCDCKDI